ncbi:MAG: hypothetical protein H6679_00930 [Epsilonproteobacteria bacterium]|nr:hypothetical protein [Campylobacterota bacterium]
MFSRKKIVIFLLTFSCFHVAHTAERNLFLLFQDQKGLALHANLAFQLFVDDTTPLKKDSSQEEGQLKALIEFLKEENALRQDGHTSLTVATSKGTINNVKTAIAKSYDRKRALNPFVIEHENYFYTPVGYAFKKDETREHHQKKPVLYNIMSNYLALTYTPLMLALKAGKFDIVHFLLDQEETNVNVITNDNTTALYMAISMPVQATLPQIQCKGQNAHRVITPTFPDWQTKVTIIKHMLQRPDINPNISDAQGFSPLYFAALRTVRLGEGREVFNALFNHEKTNTNTVAPPTADRNIVNFIHSHKPEKSL